MPCVFVVLSVSPWVPQSSYRADVQLAIEALEHALAECGYAVEAGAGVAAWKAKIAEYEKEQQLQ